MMVEPRFVYRCYTTADTWTLLQEILGDPYFLSKIEEEHRAYGDFSPQQMRYFLHEELFEWLQTSLLDIDWQQLADEINVRF